MFHHLDAKWEVGPVNKSEVTRFNSQGKLKQIDKLLYML